METYLTPAGLVEIEAGETLLTPAGLIEGPEVTAAAEEMPLPETYRYLHMLIR
jgi:hypothetical protein